jgi:mRNA interferase MazF
MEKKTHAPKRGEIWLVDFEPQVAEEIRKTRPAVVLTIPELKHIPIRAAVPIRGERTIHQEIFYMVSLSPGVSGLEKPSSVDCSQVKTFSLQRFVKKIGALTREELELVTDTVSFCLGQ